jgi:hypothetical protein
MRRTSLRMTAWLAATLIVLAACAFAQDFTQKPKSPAPDGLRGKQLIVWTETQKPHPLPVTSPEMYRTSSQTQILTGTILAQGPDLLFAATDRANYRLDKDNDNQEQLRAFAGQKVRISGNVDQATRLVHVLSIEQP